MLKAFRILWVFCVTTLMADPGLNNGIEGDEAGIQPAFFNLQSERVVSTRVVGQGGLYESQGWEESPLLQINIDSVRTVPNEKTIGRVLLIAGTAFEDWATWVAPDSAAYPYLEHASTDSGAAIFVSLIVEACDGDQRFVPRIPMVVHSDFERVVNIAGVIFADYDLGARDDDGNFDLVLGRYGLGSVGRAAAYLWSLADRSIAFGTSVSLVPVEYSEFEHVATNSNAIILTRYVLGACDGGVTFDLGSGCYRLGMVGGTAFPTRLVGKVITIRLPQLSATQSVWNIRPSIKRRATVFRVRGIIIRIVPIRLGPIDQTPERDILSPRPDPI